MPEQTSVVVLWIGVWSNTKTLKMVNGLEDQQSIYSSRYDCGGTTKMVGLDDQIKKLKGRILGGWNTLRVISIVGMAGIGKTTLAEEIYHDPIVLRHFEVGLFLTVGPKYELAKLLLFALDQLGIRKTDAELGDHLYRRLFGKRYLVVLDDVWSTHAWDEMKRFFPDNKNKSRIITTTRLAHIMQSVDNLPIRFLNDEESWELLRKTVFASDDRSCSPRLEIVGRKIAKNCEGLPLAIIEVGKILCKMERNVETWIKIAENEDPLVIGMDDDTRVSKALSLSYEMLAKHLKLCFLYMGVFPKKYELSPSKLINLWVCEGFLESTSDKTLEEVAKECLDELVSTSLILVSKESSSGGMKTCRIHFVYRNLCIGEAKKENFFCIVKKFVDIFPKDTNSQMWGLCFHNNIVLGIKQVHKSLESVSAARSLLCFGPNQQYPIQVYLRFRLLRLLDVVTIRFYEFPHEVVNLVELRYLAITCDREIPPSISRLCNLEVLIVRRHHQIVKCSYDDDDIMYLPMAIWILQKLRHLQCMGFELPNPSRKGGFDGSVILENLSTLCGVSAHSCVRGVLERMPNLKKLGIEMVEYASIDDSVEAYKLDNVALYLHSLESFKCVMVNRDFGSQVPDSIPYPTFSYSIRKLTLSGCGYPWDYMMSINRLSNLEVLKLRCNAFRGREWYSWSEIWPLKFLLLEDLDIERCTASFTSFPRLKCLIFRHCYKLQEIPFNIGDMSTLELIEVDDCHPSLVISVKNMYEELQESRLESLQLRIISSWDDKKLKSS